MIEKTAGAASIESMLAIIRAHQTEASRPTELGLEAPTPASRRVDFGEMVKSGLDSVNSMHMESRRLQAAYDSGEDVPLTDVVLAMQKSSLATEATIQIRNKVLKAYEDIMNMPV